MEKVRPRDFKKGQSKTHIKKCLQGSQQGFFFYFLTKTP